MKYIALDQFIMIISEFKMFLECIISQCQIIVKLNLLRTLIYSYIHIILYTYYLYSKIVIINLNFIKNIVQTLILRHVIFDLSSYTYS